MPASLPSLRLFSALRLGPLILALSVGISACSALTSDEPPVADSTMVEVLIELHLAGARTDVLHDLAPAERDAILARYGLDEARFQEITDYYVDHPQAYVDVYSTVLDRLNAERATQNGLPPTEE